MLTNLPDWINEVSGSEFVWFVKRLTGNDTLANKSHQAGPYIPKSFLFRVFPSLNRPEVLNPDVWFDLSIDSHSDYRKGRAVWYNNKFHTENKEPGKSLRNEARITNLGGGNSPLLDPESTGALTVFAFLLGDTGDAKACHVWVCQHATEEDLIEELIGPVEPGQFKIRTQAEVSKPGLFGIPEKKPRISCHLEQDEFPSEWLAVFPSGADIIKKTVELRPDHSFNPDLRLMKRRECEFEIFLSVEEAVELPVIKKGFSSIEEFTAKAQSILQRRKARSGRSLELHTREIFIEEGLRENEDFSHQPESDPGKKPDFIFPSGKDYKNSDFPNDRLRMLAVKTTCKDRWRQILNEADRIGKKHLLTLQEGVSENQFREMAQADVQLVVPTPVISLYPKSVQPHLQTLESFIADIRLLKL